MKRLGFLACIIAAACACKTRGGNGNGNGTGTGTAATGECGAVQSHVAELYRAEAQAQASAEKEKGTGAGKGTEEIEEAVADNVTMVMNDCVTQPAKIAPCLKKAGSVAELEDRCLIPLDEEGTEGEKLP